ncbi:MAG: hypothetical protein V1816_15725 [Pseudomonadota bacterium]
MKPVFCFIDDSAFELENFRAFLAPAAPGIDFILGFTYREIKSQLGARQPCLFLLDLYGRFDKTANPVIPSLDELKVLTSSFGTIEDVYRGLDDFQGDKTNEFLKRLFHLVQSWRFLFYETSRQAGQDIRYGLDNLAQARRDYPAAAAVAYTRKSLIMDAVEVVRAGVDGLSLKPDGPDDQAIARATTEAAPGLIEDWSALVSARFSGDLKNLAGVLIQAGLAGEVSRLPFPDKMSKQAQAVLGPGDWAFLEAAAAWWSLAGHDPIL